MDRFIFLDIPLDKVLEFIEDRPLDLFELVRNIIEDETGQVYDVEVYRKYFNPRSLDIVVEYLIKCRVGEVSVKLIYSNDPVKALRKYYEAEKDNT